MRFWNWQEPVSQDCPEAVKMLHIAEKLGTNEYSFSRKMRKELPKEEKEKIIKIIEEMED